VPLLIEDAVVALVAEAILGERPNASRPSQSRPEVGAVTQTERQARVTWWRYL
jgi:hypothetical protein